MWQQWMQQVVPGIKDATNATTAHRSQPTAMANGTRKIGTFGLLLLLSGGE